MVPCPPWAALSDTDLAAVVTYTKNAWSNKTGPAGAARRDRGPARQVKPKAQRNVLRIRP